MDWMSYGVNVLIAASCWFVGIMIARFVIRKFFAIESPEMMGNGVSTDDVLEFDKSDMPYIPVKVTKENGLYYAWFKGNDKFIGQSECEEDIELMAYRHMMKMVGLRMEFKHEEEPSEAEVRLRAAAQNVGA